MSPRQKDRALVQEFTAKSHSWPSHGAEFSYQKTCGVDVQNCVSNNSGLVEDFRSAKNIKGVSALLESAGREKVWCERFLSFYPLQLDVRPGVLVQLGSAFVFSTKQSQLVVTRKSRVPERGSTGGKSLLGVVDGQEAVPGVLD